MHSNKSNNITTEETNPLDQLLVSEEGYNIHSKRLMPLNDDNHRCKIQSGTKLKMELFTLQLKKFNEPTRQLLLNMFYKVSNIQNDITLK